jgi:hypothetical protein
LYRFTSLQNSKLRCVYCHENLEQAARYECPDCHSIAHTECAKELGVCTTIGCETSYPGMTRTKPRCDFCYRDRQETVDLVIIEACKTCQKPTLTRCNCCRSETRSYCRHMFNGRTCDMCEAQRLLTTATCPQCNTVIEETCYHCQSELMQPHNCKEKESIFIFLWNLLARFMLYILEPKQKEMKGDRSDANSDPTFKRKA